MKKLLLVAIVAMSAMYQTSPMVFRKSHKNQYVPVFPLGGNAPVSDQQQDKGICQEKFFNDKRGLQQAIEYNPKDNDENFIKGEIKAQPMIKYACISIIDKDAMNAWCDAFKKNSKKPAMWTQDVQKEREIEKVHNCIFEENKGRDIIDNVMAEVGLLNPERNVCQKSDLEFFSKIGGMQKNEWNGWQQDSSNANKIYGIQVIYKKPKSKKKLNSSNVGSKQHKVTPIDYFRHFIAFNQSPYYKKGNNDEVLLANELENNIYHNALQSLQMTQAAIERDLHDQSYFQRLWNYGKRQNSWQALARVNNEIALFKNQDATAFDPENQVNKDKTTKIKLTHREVFTRSSMPKSLFEQVKAARE
jgi:hypothetical protein